MPNYTSNLNLEKPLQTETYNIDVHNANSDKIDTAYKEQADAMQEHKTKTPLDHPDKSVTEPKMADGAVSTRTIAPKAVTEEKLADSGVTPGIYSKVTVDRTGRVIAGDNIPVFRGATPAANGSAGLVPAPSKAEAGKVLGANGQWITPYSHPNSGVIAGTYRNVTVNNQGHVTGGNNPTLAIAEGGTGANNRVDACKNLGAVRSVNNVSPDADGNVTIVDIYSANGNTQYIKFHNGFCMQYFMASFPSGSKYSDITFPIPMANTNYCVGVLDIQGGNPATNLYYSMGFAMASDYRTTTGVRILASYAGETSGAVLVLVIGKAA